MESKKNEQLDALLSGGKRFVTHIHTLAADVDAKFGENWNNYQNWLAKQHITTDVGFNIAHGALSGALIGLMFWANPYRSPRTSFERFFKLNAVQSHLYPRHFALVMGAGSGVGGLTKRVRGKRDTLSFVTSAFVCGITHSLLRGTAPPNCGLEYAISEGIVLAGFLYIMIKG